VTKSGFLKLGITSRVTENISYVEKRDAISHDWSKFLEKIHAYPIVIPNSISKPQDFFSEMDLNGFILSGGDNIGDNPERDRIEKSILDYGINKMLPIFGVCRGMQVINAYFGGSIQNISNNDHVNTNHIVKIQNNEFFAETQNLMQVNSYHNNIIKKGTLGKNLTPFAISQHDDTIEGFFHNEFPIRGVMWHPERQQTTFDQKMFQNFFTTSAKS